MEDKEKILRCDLQNAKNELNKPIMDGLLDSAILTIKRRRKEKVIVCEKRLYEYLNTK